MLGSPPPVDAPQPLPTRAMILWQGSYEDGRYHTTWDGAEIQEGGLAPTILNPYNPLHEQFPPMPFVPGLPARSRVARIECPAGTKRSELAKRSIILPGEESYWRFLIYLGPDYVPVAGKTWNVLAQMHTQWVTSVSPNFEIAVSALDPAAPTLGLVFRGGAIGTLEQVKSYAPIGSLSEYRGWLDVIYHEYCAPNFDGYVEAWVNGRRLIQLSHMPTLWAGGVAKQVKAGIYRASSALNPRSVVLVGPVLKAGALLDLVDGDLERELRLAAAEESLIELGVRELADDEIDKRQDVDLYALAARLDSLEARLTGAKVVI